MWTCPDCGGMPRVSDRSASVFDPHGSWFRSAFTDVQDVACRGRTDHRMSGVDGATLRPNAVVACYESAMTSTDACRGVSTRRRFFGSAGPEALE